MSTFVLQRKYALQLPNSFVDVDSEEMEYIEGGGSWGQEFLISTLSTVVGGLIVHAVTKGMVRTALTALGGWVANTFYSIACWAAFNPAAAGLAVVGIATAVGGYILWRYYR